MELKEDILLGLGFDYQSIDAPMIEIHVSIDIRSLLNRQKEDFQQLLIATQLIKNYTYYDMF